MEAIPTYSRVEVSYRDNLLRGTILDSEWDFDHYIYRVRTSTIVSWFAQSEVTLVKWKRSDISTRLVLSAVAYCTLNKDVDLSPLDFVQYLTKCPHKVVWRAFEREDDRGYLEYGTSLRRCWFTEKGTAHYNHIHNNLSNEQ